MKNKEYINKRYLIIIIYINKCLKYELIIDFFFLFFKLIINYIVNFIIMKI